MAMQNNFEFNTHETLAEYHKSMISLFVSASDKVIQTVGELNTYLSETSKPDKPRIRKDFEKKLIDVFEEMRLDCFEKSKLTSKELADLLPFTH